MLRRSAGRRGPQAEIALYHRATPVWYRLRIDLRSHRVQRVRMIAERHFMTKRYLAFNIPVSIDPPRHSAR